MRLHGIYLRESTSEWGLWWNNELLNTVPTKWEKAWDALLWKVNMKKILEDASDEELLEFLSQTSNWSNGSPLYTWNVA